MLRHHALSELLNQANTGGVLSTLLLNKEGSLLAYANTPGHNESKKTAPIAAHIWSAYEKNSKSTFEDSPTWMIMECETGNIGLMKVANLLVCMYTTKDCCLGMIKQKLEALRNTLEEPLWQIATS